MQPNNCNARNGGGLEVLKIFTVLRKHTFRKIHTYKNSKVRKIRDIFPEIIPPLPGSNFTLNKNKTKKNPLFLHFENLNE